MSYRNFSTAVTRGIRNYPLSLPRPFALRKHTSMTSMYGVKLFLESNAATELRIANLLS